MVKVRVKVGGGLGHHHGHGFGHGHHDHHNHHIHDHHHHHGVGHHHHYGHRPHTVFCCLGSPSPPPPHNPGQIAPYPPAMLLVDSNSPQPVIYPPNVMNVNMGGPPPMYMAQNGTMFVTPNQFNNGFTTPGAQVPGYTQGTPVFSQTPVQVPIQVPVYNQGAPVFNQGPPVQVYSTPGAPVYTTGVIG